MYITNQAIFGNASFRGNHIVVFAILTIGSSEGGIWQKSVLKETNNVVHEILKLCNGYQITLCDGAYDYQTETEGIYCMDDINLYYNSYNYLYLFVDTCKLDFIYLFPPVKYHSRLNS